MASSSSSSFLFPAAGTRSLFRVDTAGFPPCRRPMMTQLKKISQRCCIRADLDSNVSDMRTNGTPFPHRFYFKLVPSDSDFWFLLEFQFQVLICHSVGELDL